MNKDKAFDRRIDAEKSFWNLRANFNFQKNKFSGKLLETRYLSNLNLKNQRSSFITARKLSYRKQQTQKQGAIIRNRKFPNNKITLCDLFDLTSKLVFVPPNKNIFIRRNLSATANVVVLLLFHLLWVAFASFYVGRINRENKT